MFLTGIVSRIVSFCALSKQGARNRVGEDVVVVNLCQVAFCSVE